MDNLYEAGDILQSTQSGENGTFEKILIVGVTSTIYGHAEDFVFYEYKVLLWESDRPSKDIVFYTTAYVDANYFKIGHSNLGKILYNNE